MTAVGAAALGLVWGWLTAAVLPSAPRLRSLAAAGAAVGALAAEAFVIAGTAGAFAVVAGVVGGVNAQRAWRRALRMRLGGT